MTSLKTYDLFISHAWEYNSEYYRLVNLLNKAPRFTWRNYSVPEHDPLGGRTSATLTAALNRQISPANAVLVIAGMYVNYREWIQKEIEMATAFGKPIIGVVPWGGQLTPVAVQTASKTMVNWNTDSIVAAIRTYAL